MTTDDYVEPDIMTWFPRREDYEDKPEIKPDENYEDKLQRLLETIEAAQNSIKEVVDGNTCTLEHKVYRVMDTIQDMDDILKLQKDKGTFTKKGCNHNSLRDFGMIEIR